MATLGPLYPTADGAAPVSIAYSTGTTAYSLINSDPDTAPTTSSWIEGLYNSANCDIWMALGDTPTDFQSMDSVEIRVYLQSTGVLSNDTVQVQVGVATADSAETFLAGASSTTAQEAANWTGGTFTAGVYQVNATYVNTSATKTQWDNAYLHISWTKSKAGGWDTGTLQVAAIEVNGVYTQAATDRRGQVSFAELEVGDAPRRAQVSFAELETGNAGRRAQVSFAELETGDAPPPGYYDLNGTSTAYVSTPDHPSYPTGSTDLDVRVFAEMDGPTGSTAETLVAQGDPSVAAGAWVLKRQASTTALQFIWRESGGTTRTATSSTGLAQSAGRWYRATLDVSNGSSVYEVTFYYSDDPVTTDPASVSWTQHGTSVTGAAATTINDGTAALSVGNRDDEPSEALDGRIYKMQLRNGIGGTVVANANFTADNQGAASSTALLVVADATTPTAGDAILKGRLEDHGYTVTYISDETAEASGYDLVVIAESCTSTVLTTKYKDSASPVLHHENAAWDDHNLTNAAGATGTGSTFDVTDSTHPIAAMLSGTGLTMYDSGTDYRYTADGNLPSGANVVISAGGTSNRIVVAYNSGATLQASDTAENKRVLFQGLDGAYTNFNWRYRQVWDAAVMWLTGDGDTTGKVWTAAAGATWTLGSTDRRSRVSFAEFEVPSAPRRSQVSFAELEIPDGARRGQISFAELEIPDGARRGQISWSELETPAPPRRAAVSFTELEVPTAPRRAQVSFAEMEAPESPKQAWISFAEMEIPDGARRAQVSFAEMETTDPPRRGQLSFAELELPDAPRRGQLSFAELEVPTAPRRAQVAFAEVELPTAPRRGQISFSELEVPNAPTTNREANISWAEMEVPTAPRRAHVSFAEMEVNDAPRRAQVAFAEYEVPDAPRRAQVTWAELEMPDGARRGQLSFAELEVGDAPRRAQLSFAELEVGDGARRAQLSFAEMEIPNSDNAVRISWAALEIPNAPGAPETTRRAKFEGFPGYWPTGS